MSTTETGAAFVKVNQLKDGSTWNVHVSADGNTIEELRKAKETALLISRELHEELRPTAAEDVTEVPF